MVGVWGGVREETEVDGAKYPSCVLDPDALYFKDKL